MRLVVVLLLSGCLFEDRLVECPAGLLCPVGTVCDTVHGGCISPEQAEVCVGSADGGSCVAGEIVGYCLDQICIDPRCGNRVVDPDELCDDGNRVDGDGCSATCASFEVCGDGVVVSALGEQCDDGNLASHDGCDSRCLEERLVWTVDELGPVTTKASHMTFDPVRGQTVVVSDGYVWGWNGARWSVLSASAPEPRTSYDVVFDSQRGRLLVIAQQLPASDALEPNAPYDRLFEWDGATWTSRTTTMAPPVSSLTATYDSARGRVFAVGFTSDGTMAYELDVTTGAWSTVAGWPVTDLSENGSFDEIEFRLDVAYDVARGRSVVVRSDASPAVHEWDGVAWTSSAQPAVRSTFLSLLYDAGLSRVVAIGYASSASQMAALAWNGTTWSALPPLAGGRTGAAVAYDGARGLRVVIGGGGIDLRLDAISESTATGWLDVPPSAPPTASTTTCSYDQERRELVCAGKSIVLFEDLGPISGPVETWAWNGEWRRRSTAPARGPIAYDPARRAIVAVSNGTLEELDDAGWTSSPLQGTAPGEPLALAYDPRSRLLVATARDPFASTASTLLVGQDNRSEFFRSSQYTNLAFDARNGGVIATDASGNAAQLVGASWQRVVGPGSGYRALSSPRRGTVEFLAPGMTTVERVGTSWASLGVPPHPIEGPAVTDPHTGELHQLGLKGASRFMLHRRWESDTPFETCEAGLDVDTDGLAGCDDPDCWATCTPACPPLTTCP